MGEEADHLPLPAWIDLVPSSASLTLSIEGKEAFENEK